MNHHQRLFRSKLWAAVLVIQCIGLILVLVTAPKFFDLLSTANASASINGLFNERSGTVFASIGFLSLAILNTLAVFGIWNSERWVKFYLFLKLVAVLVLGLSVFVLEADYLLLLAYIPLFCSLLFMLWAYRMSSNRNGRGRRVTHFSLNTFV